MDLTRVYQAIARRPQIVKETPDIAFGAIGKQMGEEWRGMSDAEKKPYQDKADKAKAKYEKEKAKYGECNLPSSWRLLVLHHGNLRVRTWRRCQEEVITQRSRMPKGRQGAAMPRRC